MSETKIYNLSRIEPKQLFKGAEVRFVHSEHMTVAYWQFESGILLPEHSHPHEQITNIMGGKFELCIDGTRYELGTGETAIIPANAKHSGRSITACYIIDIFHPVREDYR